MRLAEPVKRPATAGNGVERRGTKGNVRGKTVLSDRSERTYQDKRKKSTHHVMEQKGPGREGGLKDKQERPEEREKVD